MLPVSTGLRHLHQRALCTPCFASRRAATVPGRVYSTRPSGADRYLTPMEVVLQHRAQLRSSRPSLLMRVAGVTFEGRQEAVAALHPGQGVAFEKQPDNPFDPDAVAVHTLDNTPLGYVPRGQTSSFPLRLCFGSVQSVGQGEGGSWGCRVDVQPSVPPVAVLAIPTSLHGHTRVAELLHGQEGWGGVRRRVLEAGRGHCTISGALRPSVSERWEFDEGRRLMRLVGFAALAPEVVRVQRMLETGQALRPQLQAMNGWSEDDVERYLGGVRSVQAWRGEQPWLLDLRALKGMRLDVPPDLTPFAV